MNINVSDENNIVEAQTEQTKEFTQSKGVLSCYEWVESIITALIIVVVIFTFLFRIVTVSGPSMQPNLQDGYRLVLSSFNCQLKQGNIVVIAPTAKMPEPIIKRVIALPGQKVDINDKTGRISVDGKMLDESAYIQNGITKIPLENAVDGPVLTFPQIIPSGHIFVLGDNRLRSKDSRYAAVGMVDEKNIIGKTELILFPFGHIGKIG